MSDIPRKSFDSSHVEEYKKFDKISFSWKFIEAPSFDKYAVPLIDFRSKVLDLGCGAGRVGEHLIKSGLAASSLCGIDVSGSMVREAQERIPKAYFAVAGSTSLPFSDERFDLVVSNLVLHLMGPAQLEQTLKEISRVLRPGGSYFGVEVNPYQDSVRPRLNEWVTTRTPWGAELSVFRHDYRVVMDKLKNDIDLGCDVFAYPDVEALGKGYDATQYSRYTAKDLRVCMLLQKR